MEKLPPCYSTGVSSSSCPADGKRFGQNTVYLRASLGVFYLWEASRDKKKKRDMKKIKNKSRIKH